MWMNHNRVTQDVVETVGADHKQCKQHAEDVLKSQVTTRVAAARRACRTSHRPAVRPQMSGSCWPAMRMSLTVRCDSCGLASMAPLWRHAQRADQGRSRGDACRAAAPGRRSRAV